MPTTRPAGCRSKAITSEPSICRTRCRYPARCDLRPEGHAPPRARSIRWRIDGSSLSCPQPRRYRSQEVVVRRRSNDPSRRLEMPRVMHAMDCRTGPSEARIATDELLATDGAERDEVAAVGVVRIVPGLVVVAGLPPSGVPTLSSQQARRPSAFEAWPGESISSVSTTPSVGVSISLLYRDAALRYVKTETFCLLGPDSLTRSRSPSPSPPQGGRGRPGGSRRGRRHRARGRRRRRSAASLRGRRRSR